MGSTGVPGADSTAAARVRMVDIARRAGVSRSAVSFVLGGGERAARVGAETAAKIRRIARQLNFHPNHAARQLAGKRSGLLGAVAGDWFHQTPLRVLSWLNHLASTRGFEIVAGELHDEPEALDRFVNKCGARGLDGVVFVALENDALWPATAQSLSQLPRVVSVVGDPQIPGASCAYFDAADGVRQVVDYFHRQGRRKIVQVLENVTAQMNRERQQALVAVHHELGRPCQADQTCAAGEGWDKDTDFSLYMKLCEDVVLRRGADAILANDDFTAVSLLRALRRLGRRVPDDVAVIGWGNEQVAYWSDPPLTTVNYMFKNVVGTALELLTAMIERPDGAAPQKVVIKPELIARESA